VWRKRKRGRLSVFRGREAKLNRAIFHILALKGPLTIYDIHKEVKTRRRLRDIRYPSVLKRVRALEEPGYVKKIGARRTKAGFEASIYGLTAKAQLAVLLDSMNLDEFLTEVDETTTLAILAAIKKPKSSSISQNNEILDMSVF
jgi:DNA-binding Lrp family transcriptional regulator